MGLNQFMDITKYDMFLDSHYVGIKTPQHLYIMNANLIAILGSLCIHNQDLPFCYMLHTYILNLLVFLVRKMSLKLHPGLNVFWCLTANPVKVHTILSVNYFSEVVYSYLTELILFPYIISMIMFKLMF